MAAGSGQSARGNVAGLFEKLWPNLRFLGLGIILTCIHLEEDFVSSVAAINPGTNIMAMNGIWLYGGMLVAFVGFAVVRVRATQLLDRRGMRTLILLLCLLGAACVILACSTVFENGGSAGARALFGVGVALFGIVAALTLIQCARLYLLLEPGEVLFFSFMSQLLMFVLYSVFNSYSQYVVWPGGPTYSGLLGVCLLPLLAWWCMGTPDEGEGGPAAETAGIAAERAGGSHDRGMRDYLRLPFAERASLSPSFILLLLTILIITGTMFATLNALIATQPANDFFFDVRLGMLLRLVLVLILFVMCFALTKLLPVEKTLWVGFACIPALPALLLLLGVPAKVQVLVAVGALFLLDFFVWVVLILAAQTKGENALLLFVLGMAAAELGTLVGTLLGSSPGGSALLAGNRLSGACLLLVVVVLLVVLFNEQRIREILGGVGKDGLNVRKVLDKPADEAALSPTPRMALWAQSCHTVGERSGLSEREQEVLRQLADNRTPQDIADHLYISLHTVRTHTKNIYAKLGVHSRDELIALVRKEYEALK